MTAEYIAELVLSLILLYAFILAFGGFLYSTVIYMWKGDPVGHWSGGGIHQIGLVSLLILFGILMFLHEKRKPRQK